jgi:TM2 domain-containing membrane protein YozV
MIIRIIFFILTFSIFQSQLSAQTDSVPVYSFENQISIIENLDTHKISTPKKSEIKYRESKRFVAAVLCLTLGPFGMHRLYLGATPQVAAAYSVTLGAIGILPVVDLLLITFSKDISRFKNNGKVIMWGK